MSARHAAEVSDSEGILDELFAAARIGALQVRSARFPATPIKALIALPEAETWSLDCAFARLREKPGLARAINDQLSADVPA